MKRGWFVRMRESGARRQPPYTPPYARRTRCLPLRFNASDKLRRIVQKRKLPLYCPVTAVSSQLLLPRDNSVETSHCLLKQNEDLKKISLHQCSMLLNFEVSLQSVHRSYFQVKTRLWIRFSKMGAAESMWLYG